jgi:Flp pilus assembly secretin CpaC
MRRGVRLMIARFSACALGLALLLTSISMSRADETITLTLGRGSIFRVSEPFKTVLIGNPDVVDVQTQDDRSVILKALKLGASNIIFLNRQSIAIGNIRVVVSDAQI